MGTTASLTLKFSSNVGFENDFSTSCNEFIKRLSTLSYSEIEYQSDNTFTMSYERIQHFSEIDLRSSIYNLPITVDASLYIYDGENEPWDFICTNNTVTRIHLDDVELEHLCEDTNLFDLREDL